MSIFDYIFKKDITRKVQGVVTIGNEDEKQKKQAIWLASFVSTLATQFS